MPTHVGQVIDLPVDQVVTRQDHLSAGLGQSLDKAQVQRVQNLLMKAGYPLQGGADGVVGRTTKKAVELVQGKINVFYKSSKVSITGTPDATVLRELDSGNRAYLANDEDKKAVRALWSSSSSGGGMTNMPLPRPAGDIIPEATPPAAAAPAGPGIMDKYGAWLQDKPIPEFLKNPYVAAGAVVVTTAALFFGIRALTKSEPAPAVAGLGEDFLVDMKKAMRPQPKRKKRRKSRRKSKK